MLQANVTSNAAKDAGEQIDVIKAKITQLDLKVASRWNKKARTIQTVTEEIAEDDHSAGNEPRPSRDLVCEDCKGIIDAKQMQLRVQDGHRVINCPHCQWQGRSSRLNCTCGYKWFLCKTHTEDPPTHKHRRPPKNISTAAAKPGEVKLSTRPAPINRSNDSAESARKAKAANRSLHEHRQKEARPSPQATEFSVGEWHKRRRLKQEAYTEAPAGDDTRRRKAQEIAHPAAEQPARESSSSSSSTTPMDYSTGALTDDILRSSSMTKLGYDYLSALPLFLGGSALGQRDTDSLGGNALDSVSKPAPHTDHTDTYTLFCSEPLPSHILSCSALLPPTPMVSNATFISDVAGSPDDGTSTNRSTCLSSSSGRQADKKDGNTVPRDLNARTPRGGRAGSPHDGSAPKSLSPTLYIALSIEEHLRRDSHTKDRSTKTPPSRASRLTSSKSLESSSEVNARSRPR